MKKAFVLNVILILVAASLLAACGGNQPSAALPSVVISRSSQSGDVATSSTPPIPAATNEPAAGGGTSFSHDVAPIFQANCSRCHGASITDYNTLTGSGLIVSGDSQNSHIIQILQAGIMPRGGRRLSDADIQTIANWIDAGATNN